MTQVQPNIQLLQSKKIIGIRMSMSLADNKTALLWKTFMPRRKEIMNNVNEELFSINIYPAGYNPANLADEFEKWAAVEVSNDSIIPENMQSFTLQEGLYAVFHYKGSGNDTSIFQYIFTEWLPSSGYVLDNRPHFEVLGKLYKNASPDSEEDIWIPIKPKSNLQ
ncbi:MAG: GyrI-like domain-containing protein [Lacibacter sp.]